MKLNACPCRQIISNILAINCFIERNSAPVTVKLENSFALYHKLAEQNISVSESSLTVTNSALPWLLNSVKRPCNIGLRKIKTSYCSLILPQMILLNIYGIIQLHWLSETLELK